VAARRRRRRRLRLLARGRAIVRVLAVHLTMTVRIRWFARVGSVLMVPRRRQRPSRLRLLARGRDIVRVLAVRLTMIVRIRWFARVGSVLLRRWDDINVMVGCDTGKRGSILSHNIISLFSQSFNRPSPRSNPQDHTTSRDRATLSSTMQIPGNLRYATAEHAPKAK
jgi:hypothetical protein